jgi:hypothetical protein
VFSKLAKPLSPGRNIFHVLTGLTNTQMHTHPKVALVAVVYSFC